MTVLGREQERATLAAILGAARSGSGAALLLVGDAGAGKSALLNQAARDAAEMQVLRPAPAALDTAGSEPLRAGLAVLRLLVSASQRLPLLCLVDDADQLDLASRAALAVAARRVAASPVVMLLAAREHTQPFGDLPCLHIGELSLPSAERLLHRLTGGALDPWVRHRLAVAVGGNPQGLTDLATRYSPAELGRIAISPAPALVSDNLLAYFGAGTGDLPADTRALLLALAAAPDRDVTLAGPALGFNPGSWRPALRAGLLEGWPRPRFTHPLVRSAVYFGAPPGQRRRVHAAIAGLPGSPGGRVWHRAAHVRPGPDEGLATELADTAEVTASVSERCLLQVLAGELSADPGTRAVRYAAGAHAALIAGASSYARALAGQAETHLRHDAAAQARAAATGELARSELGQLPNRSAAAWLLEAARAQRPVSVTASRESMLCALSHVVLAGHRACGITPAVMSEQMAALDFPAGGVRDLGVLLLQGFGHLFAGDYAAATRSLRQALNAAAAPAVLERNVPDWFPLVAVASLIVWDDTAGLTWLHRVTGTARAAGALLHEKLALSLLQYLEAPCRGDGEAVIAASELAAGGRLALMGPVVTALGRGQFPAALRAATDICAEDVLHLEQQLLPYLVEAAAACGRLDQARAALGTLRARAAVAETDWAFGQLHCSEGILARGELMDGAFVAAIELLSQTQRTADLARAHLLYGESLTRHGRPAEGGIQLRTAAGLFSRFRAAAYTSRARRALHAAGERPATREPAAGEELTDQELRIARLAGAGATNRGIGSQLFIQPTTVDYHLHRIYRKLGVSSRRDLSGALAERTRAG